MSSRTPVVVRCIPRQGFKGHYALGRFWPAGDTAAELTAEEADALSKRDVLAVLDPNTVRAAAEAFFVSDAEKAIIQEARQGGGELVALSKEEAAVLRGYRESLALVATQGAPVPFDDAELEQLTAPAAPPVPETPAEAPAPKGKGKR